MTAFQMRTIKDEARRAFAEVVRPELEKDVLKFFSDLHSEGIAFSEDDFGCHHVLSPLGRRGFILTCEIQYKGEEISKYAYLRTEEQFTHRPMRALLAPSV
jgi:hypothetical protein